jgi:hypothetical protein
MQGTVADDGFESLHKDTQYMDIIHIDPWKAYPVLEDGISQTIKMIEFCFSLNPRLQYEVGTEEAIRPYGVVELRFILNELKTRLQPEAFGQIKYAVIQCGTQLSAGNNIGSFDADKLARMIHLTKELGLVAKEHNGDWISLDIHKKKERRGLTCVNVAPEMAKIESAVLLQKMTAEDIEIFYQLCLHSGKWKKWVAPDFDFVNKKEEMILIAGHYVFSHPTFLFIKSKYKNIDKEIQAKIYERLEELHSL